MARTVNQAERAARGAAILRAAIEVSARQGLEATLLADIAARIGVRHPTILNYFASKEALFAAAVVEPLAQLGAVLRPAPREALPAVVARHVTLFMAQGPYLRLTQDVLAQAGRVSPLGDAQRGGVGRAC